MTGLGNSLDVGYLCGVGSGGAFPFLEESAGRMVTQGTFPTSTHVQGDTLLRCCLRPLLPVPQRPSGGF